MTFNQILPYLHDGEKVRRRDWRRGSRIQFEKHYRFVQLTSDLGRTNWNPYPEDFGANNWEVVGGKPKETFFGRIRKLVG